MRFIFAIDLLQHSNLHAIHLAIDVLQHSNLHAIHLAIDVLQHSNLHAIHVAIDVLHKLLIIDCSSDLVVASIAPRSPH